MSNEIPYGWTSPDPENISYEFGEPRYGTGANDIPANPTGESGGEDDKHSRYVSPDSEYGAAKVKEGLGNYGNTDDYKPKKSDKDPADTGTIDLPIGHMVIEDGLVHGKPYYLVKDLKSEKMYSVVPNFKEGQTYKSGMKSDRTSALQDAFRVLSASLPESALAQLRERYPESLAL